MMNKHKKLNVALSWISLLTLGGCTIGYDTTLFATKSNFGLNFDSAPPTLEIAVSRREGVIGPTFEGGGHAPVAASFHVTAEVAAGGVSALMAGGAAAEQVTRGTADAGPNHLPDGTVCLVAAPTKPVVLPAQGDIRPFVFMTDTSIGLKASWTGMTSAVPDSFHFGFKRKDAALAPVFGNAGGCPAARPYGVKMPAFLASVDTGSDLTSVTNSHFAVNQFFATGLAAENLAGRTSIQNAFDAEAKEQFQKLTHTAFDDSAGTINCWLRGDLKTRGDQLNNYLANNHLPKADVFLADDSYAAQRQAAVNDKSLAISCPKS